MPGCLQFREPGKNCGENQKQQLWVGSTYQNLEIARMTEQERAPRESRRIALACDASEHTRHAFVWCLSQLCQPDDVLVLIHVASRAEDESHENFSPNEESAASGGEEGSLDGARSGQDTEPETCSLSGGWKVGGLALCRSGLHGGVLPPNRCLRCPAQFSPY
eukprot:2730112-Rhodomonas_salina.4